MTHRQYLSNTERTQIIYIHLIMLVAECRKGLACMFHSHQYDNIKIIL